MNQALLFIKKDFWEESSYKFSFFIKIFKIFFVLSVIFYFSNFIEKKGYYHNKTSLFQYLFIGHLFYQFLISNLKKSGSKIIMEQYKGTLELLFNSHIHPYTLMFYSNLYNSLFEYLLINVYIILGVLFFDLPLNITFLGIIQFNLSLLLVYLYLFSWGIIGASITLIIKRSDPLTSALMYYFTIAGSLYFPSKILPKWIDFFNIFFPITKSVNLIRNILYKNLFSLDDFLIIFAHFLIISLISVILFNLSIKISKKYNSLSTY